MRDVTIFDVANWFLSKEAMTPKKLQKLVYYAYAWNYALRKKELFPATYEAWVHGPVCRALWQKYNNYGWNDIEKVAVAPTFDNATTDLLESVWLTYGEKSANELEALTHRDEPWQKAREGVPPMEPCTNKISKEDIQSFYWKLFQETQGE